MNTNIENKKIEDENINYENIDENSINDEATPLDNIKKFKQLGIIEPILKSIGELKFTEPSEIQIKAIPLVVSGHDMIACSATGSGKTLAFGCGIIQKCEHDHGVQSLVLTPTRELAVQVAKSLQNFAKYKNLDVTCVYGGVSINPQMHAVDRADIVVGTPGRVLDLIDRRVLDLRLVKVLVLDEADRMFDMGFVHDVEKIISFCGKDRQTLLFSATMCDEVIMIARKHMKNPQKIEAENYVDPKKLTQVYYDVQDNMKFSLLVHLLKKEKEEGKQTGLTMVFCNTQRNTDFVSNNLRHNGIDTLAIHGGFSQEKRNKTMQDFHSGNFAVLVCTDVAARGLDIPNVSHIYNYDLPEEAKQYIHRIGRTARAGKDGIAINLLSQRDYDNFSGILRDGDLEITKLERPQVEKVEIVIERRSSFGGRGGGFRGDNRFGGNGQRGGFGRRGPSHGGGSRFGGPRRDGPSPNFRGRREGELSENRGPRTEGSSEGHSSGPRRNPYNGPRGQNTEHHGAGHVGHTKHFSEKKSE